MTCTDTYLFVCFPLVRLGATFAVVPVLPWVGTSDRVAVHGMPIAVRVPDTHWFPVERGFYGVV